MERLALSALVGFALALAIAMSFPYLAPLFSPSLAGPPAAETRQTIVATQTMTPVTATQTVVQTMTAIPTEISALVEIKYMVGDRQLEVEQEGRVVGYWVSIPAGESKRIPLEFTLKNGDPKEIIPELVSLPIGVKGSFDPPRLVLAAGQAEPVILTLQVDVDIVPKLYIISIRAGSSAETLYLLTG
jgi:hypothetical protein